MLVYRIGPDERYPVYDITKDDYYGEQPIRISWFRYIAYRVIFRLEWRAQVWLSSQE